MWLAVALVVGAAAASGREAPDIAARMTNVERLLQQSSGAQQVERSRNPQAQRKRAEARELFEQARAAHERGDQANADALLHRVTRLMFDAIRLATPKTLGADFDQANYASRRESVEALRDAFDRISGDGGDRDGHARVAAQLDVLLDEAERLRIAGETDAARIELDKAYHLLKVGIDSIRSGQTLVRSLQFGTPREEYLYEIDRNDTHGMLVGLLIDDRDKSAAARAKVEQYVDQAKVLRRQAEAYAGDEAYVQAIELLEESTRQLVRAIRGAGIYIPG